MYVLLLYWICDFSRISVTWSNKKIAKWLLYIFTKHISKIKSSHLQENVYFVAYSCQFEIDVMVKDKIINP